MVAYTFRMPAGIPGDVNRAEAAIIEPQVITPAATSGAPGAFGIGVVIDATSHQVRAVGSSDTAIYGFLVRPYPTQDYSGINPPLGTSVPPTQGACDVLVRGYMSVLLGGSAAAVKAAPVYLWVAASSGQHVQGQVEAAATSGSTIELNAYFTGPADANGITEIAWNM